MPPALICSGPSSGSRLAAPASSESPQTSRARSGMNRIGSQPSASSAVISTFLSPSEATQIGMVSRSGWTRIFSGLPRPSPWPSDSGMSKMPCDSSGSRLRPDRTIRITSRVRPSGLS